MKKKEKIEPLVILREKRMEKRRCIRRITRTSRTDEGDVKERIKAHLHASLHYEFRVCSVFVSMKKSIVTMSSTEAFKYVQRSAMFSFSVSFSFPFHGKYNVVTDFSVSRTQDAS